MFQHSLVIIQEALDVGVYGLSVGDSNTAISSSN